MWVSTRGVHWMIVVVMLTSGCAFWRDAEPEGLGQASDIPEFGPAPVADRSKKFKVEYSLQETLIGGLGLALLAAVSASTKYGRN